MNPATNELGQVRPTWSEMSQESPRAYGVLVVDDEGAIRSVLIDGMRQKGFSVWVAASGKEALDLYRRHREAIDVVLLDVRMPGLDGPQTLAALKELSPDIRACFMSGDLGEYTEEVLCGMGVAAVFLKPFHLAQLAQSLWNLVTNSNLGQSPHLSIGAANAHSAII